MRQFRYFFHFTAFVCLAIGLVGYFLFRFSSSPLFSKFIVAKVNMENEHNALKERCRDNNLHCYSTFFENFTARYGPAVSYEFYKFLKQKGQIDKAVYEHEIGHHVGAATAKNFGINLDSFTMCPMNAFNYGCQHGFFIYVFSQNMNALDAGLRICGEIKNKDMPLRSILNCYHGIGHGLMMASDNDIRYSTDQCRRLKNIQFQDYCLDGVFMENANVQSQKNKKYSETNPLYPCDSFAVRYSAMCYLQHSIYLVSFFGGDIERAQRECMRISDFDPRIYCAASFGRLFTEGPWLKEHFGTDDMSVGVRISVNYCRNFENEMRTECFFGALSSMINNDFPNVEKRALHFCSSTDEWFKPSCYSHINTSIGEQTTDDVKRFIACSQVLTKYKYNCYSRYFLTAERLTRYGSFFVQLVLDRFMLPS